MAVVASVYADGTYGLHEDDDPANLRGIRSSLVAEVLD